MNCDLFEYINFILRFTCKHHIRNEFFKRLSSNLRHQISTRNYELEIKSIDNIAIDFVVHFNVYTSPKRFSIKPIKEINYAKEEFVTSSIKKEGL